MKIESPITPLSKSKKNRKVKKKKKEKVEMEFVLSLYHTSPPYSKKPRSLYYPLSDTFSSQ